MTHTLKFIAVCALCATLSACNMIPIGPAALTANPEAIVATDDSGDAITVSYLTALMNKAEAEAYAQEQCEARGQTLAVFRHPAPTSGPTASIIFSCRRPFT